MGRIDISDGFYLKMGLCSSKLGLRMSRYNFLSDRAGQTLLVSLAISCLFVSRKLYQRPAVSVSILPLRSFDEPPRLRVEREGLFKD